MFVHQLRDFEFRADAIRGGNEDRILHFCRIETEKATETADAGDHLFAGRRLDQRFDAFDKGIGCVNVHACFFIG